MNQSINGIKKNDEDSKFLNDPNQKEFRHPGDLTARLGSVEIFFTVFKSVVGIGILYIPKGIVYSGWLCSLIGFIISFIFTFEGLRRQIIAHARFGGTYFDLAEKCGGKVVKILVEICIAISQLMFIIGYITFIILNLNSITAALGREFPEWAIGLGLGFILVPLVCVKDISIFSSLHILADIIIMSTIFFVIVYDIVQLTNDGIGPGVTSSGSVISMMRIIGIAVGACEANATIIPVYRQAFRKRTFLTIQNSALITIFIMYISYGILSYITFGTHTMGPITISMNQFKWYVQALEIAYMLAMLLTVMLQYYPVMEVVMHCTIESLDEGKLKSFLIT